MTPDEFTLSETMLDVGDGHTLYVQDWGNKDAVLSVLFLHGGPGAGCSDSHKEWFDGRHQRVVFHDQRGSGKSTPTGSLEYNTTQNLVADIEKIVDHFGLKRFIINGGSWGSCLALAYAVAHPERVAALVVRGIFTGSQPEIDWLDKGHFAAFFPDVWQAYLKRTPKAHRNDPSAYHFPRALSDDSAISKASAYAYENVEYSLIRLDDRHHEPDYETYDPSSIRIEMHYLTNGCFMPDRFLLDKAGELSMPVYIVQGRYDAICPPKTAYELFQRLPNAELTWTIAGHSSNDRATYDAQKIILTQLTRRLQ